MAASSRGPSKPSVPDLFHPKRSYKFPRRKFGTTGERSFRAEWCDTYPWLHYDKVSNSAFCHLCMRAASQGKFLASTKRDPAFISTGYTYWKEATSAFKKHQASASHREAHEALVLLPQQIRGDVGELLSQKHSDQKVKNREMFLRILKNLRYLSRQGLALRGSHGNDTESNFWQLFRLQVEDVQELETWMNRRTDNYMSPQIQNECLKLMALNILRMIGKCIHESGVYFSIMADECTDISNKEQFTICLRWVGKDLKDNEDFIGLYQVDSITADSLTFHIKDALLRLNLQLSQCRGQCYDGASNMSGIRSGVSTQITKAEKRAVYTHCYAHALNLAIGETIKRSKICCDALDVAFEISKLIKFSPKRNAAFDEIKIGNTDDQESSTGIQSFCPTRWTVRGKSVASILENFNNLKQLWNVCLETRLEPDVKGRIIGVKVQMCKYNLLFGLKLCERILLITDNLSMTLQKESMSAAEAQEIAKLTVDTLKGIRNDDSFKLFFQLIEALCEKTDTEEPILPRKRKAPRHLEVGEGEGYHSSTIEEHYRQKYFEALDLAIAGIQERFDQPGYAIYKNLECLILKAAKQEEYSNEIQEVLSFYGDDFQETDLRTQLQIFGTKFIGKSCSLKDILAFLRGLSDGQKAFFSQVCRVAQLIMVMPATNAASERSFSVLRRVKSYLRSTMTQLRLNNLMILHIYKEMLDDMDLKSIANEFVQGSEHRLSVFGNFK